MEPFEVNPLPPARPFVQHFGFLGQAAHFGLVSHPKRRVSSTLRHPARAEIMGPGYPGYEQYNEWRACNGTHGIDGFISGIC